MEKQHSVGFLHSLKSWEGVSVTFVFKRNLFAGEKVVALSEGSTFTGEKIFPNRFQQMICR